MTKENAIKFFENKKIRTVWDSDAEKWYISVIDVIEVLTGSVNPRKYWSVLKTRLLKEGSQTATNCSQLKLPAEDGRMRMTDVADVEQLFRLIQSVPSPKAEPFKLWLAEIARERLEEMDDPEKGIERLLEYYHRKGYSDQWINQRLKSIEVRKELTDEWCKRGVNKSFEYAILTNEMLREWSDFTVSEYKKYKGLKGESLRDNMTNMELVLNMLAETTATALSRKHKPETFTQNKTVAKAGASVARNTRTEIEEKLGESVVTPLKASEEGNLEIENKTPHSTE